jgi:uncharacterized repeat protein (TIGR01451 family)
MKKRRKKSSLKIGILFVTALFLLGSTSISYSLWYDELHLDVTIDTGNWDSSVKIKKTLDYFNNDFELTITVLNDGPNDLTDVEVTDTLGVDATPIFGTEVYTHGYVTWMNTPVPGGEINDLTWYIGDLLPSEEATLSFGVTVNCVAGDPVVIWPEDTNGEISHPITRTYYDGSPDETVYYRIVSVASNIVKFEDCIPETLGEDGNVETDTFVITILGGSLTVTVGTKGGGDPEEWSTLTGIGDTVVDSKGFIITIENIVDIGGGQKNYFISITSDDQTSTKSLSHTTFDFGTGGTCIIGINNGATVTADAGSICGILEATTEGITITVDTDGNVDPQLPYSTPWAEDFCDYECDCCE